MYNTERRELILEILEKKKSVSVTELADALYVSAPTMRRDLDLLEREGKVQRTHGGVLLKRSQECEIPLLIRQEQNNISKSAIAKKAIRQVKNGDVIFMDASSTVSYLVPLLEGFEELTVITNSPKTSVLLGEAAIKNYCTGGLLLRHSIAYVGADAERFIDNFNADLFFFSSRGITEDGKICDSSESEASIRKVMLKNADRCYYLCDSSKRGKKYAYNICTLKDIDEIITE